MKKITSIAIILFIIMNLTNTRLRFRGLKSRLFRFRLRRSLRPRRLIRTYSYYNRRLGGIANNRSRREGRRARRGEEEELYLGEDDGSYYY